MKIVVINILIASLACVLALGGRKPLKAEELNSKEVLSIIKYATNQIRTQKQRNGEVSECVELHSKVLRGSSQVLSGMRYNFELKVFPVPLTDKLCAAKVNSSTIHFKPEICEVEVWSHSWKMARPVEMLRATCLKVED